MSSLYFGPLVISLSGYHCITIVYCQLLVPVDFSKRFDFITISLDKIFSKTDLDKAASAACRCSWVSPLAAGPDLDWAGWLGPALAAWGWEAACASPSFWPLPANLNLASVFFFSKKRLMADIFGVFLYKDRSRLCWNLVDCYKSLYHSMNDACFRKASEMSLLFMTTVF